VFAIIFCVNVIGAGSRAGLLALVCTTMFFLIIHKSINLRYLQIKKKTVLSIILIITILFSIVLMEFYEVKQPVFIGTLERTQDQLKDLRFFGRFKLWAQSFNKSLEAPILGYGVKKMSYFNFPGDAPPHNFLLQIWLYGGIIAVLGFIWMIGSVFIKLFRRLKHSQDMWLPIVILFWVLIQSMFTNLIFADFRIAMILWLVISLFLWLPSANGNIRINLPIPGKGELA
jgi:O-antigen ligase